MAAGQKAPNIAAENERLREALFRIARITEGEPSMSGTHWPSLYPAQCERINRLANEAIDGMSPVEPLKPKA
jgi:hypothetical protein